jgi:IclR family acetate operon transcriptional repressor
MPLFVRAVDRSLALLGCFTQETPGLTLAELAGRTGLSKSTALRLLFTLQSQRFVERDPETGEYRLGIVCVELGMAALDQMDLRKVALSRLTLLRDETQETVSLTVVEDGEVVYVDVFESSQPVKIAARPGRRLPIHCTATGQVFLAFMFDDEIERALSEDLKQYTPATICDPARLREELRLIRDRGFSVSEQQFEPGIAAVAAPIWNRHGAVAAAVGLAGPAYRIPHERALELGEAVLRTADSISRQLGATLARNNHVSEVGSQP